MKFTKYSKVYEITDTMSLWNKVFVGDMVVRGFWLDQSYMMKVGTDARLKPKFVRMEGGWLSPWPAFIRHYKLRVVGKTDLPVWIK